METSIFRAMTFNVYNQAIISSYKYIIDLIRITQTDVVGLQEADPQHIIAIADELGWYADTRACILSRWPLERYSNNIRLPSGSHGMWVRVLPPHSNSFLVTSLHLPPNKYGPQQLRDNIAPNTIVMNEQEIRLPPLKIRIEAIRDTQEPTIIMMDANTPSHLDNTYVQWPISTYLQTNGYVDTYRIIRPNISMNLGLTWWAMRDNVPCTRPAPCTRREPSARIDFVYTKGLHIIDAYTVGDTSSDLIIYPWQSDHRAVVASLLLLHAQ